MYDSVIFVDTYHENHYANKVRIQIYNAFRRLMDFYYNVFHFVLPWRSPTPSLSESIKLRG